MTSVRADGFQRRSRASMLKDLILACATACTLAGCATHTATDLASTSHWHHAPPTPDPNVWILIPDPTMDQFQNNWAPYSS